MAHPGITTRAFTRFIPLLLLASAVAACQEMDRHSEAAPESTLQSQTSGPDLLDATRMAGEMFRRWGLSGQLSLVNDWSKEFRNPSASSAGIDRYSLDVAVGIDGEKALGWKGGSAFVRLKHHLGDQGGDYLGDAQGFSNIDGVPRTHLYELWFQQRALRDALRVKVGKIDANSEFAVVQTAADFLNSSMGYSPTILQLPTYPEPQPGISAFARLPAHSQLALGIFRTAGAGPMVLLEGARDWSVGAGEQSGRVSLGFWRVAGPLDRFDGDRDPGAQGFYSVLEQSLWNRSGTGTKRQSLTGFLQFGHANGEVSAFTRHLGAGMVLDHPFAIRPHDAAGLAATWIRFSDEPAAGFRRLGEMSVEFYYKFRIARFLSLVPDVQYIRDPGGRLQPADALVLTPRLNLSF